MRDSGEHPDRAGDAPAGEGIGFWVGLDYGQGTTTHYWFQAGYIVGLAPDGNWYSQPILYVEYNNGTYVFKVVATNVAYNMNHFFQVWISAWLSPPTCLIQVDGNVVVNVPAPSQMANGDQITGFLETHQLQSLGTAGNIVGTGVWSSLYYAAVSPAWCPSLSCSAWYPWGTDPLQPFYNTLGVPVITNPYTVASLSSTSFTAHLNSVGGACTCKQK